MSANILPIGKYKGQAIQKVPSDYLEWILTTSIGKNYKWAIKVELSTRQWKEQRNAKINI